MNIQSVNQAAPPIPERTVANASTAPAASAKGVASAKAAPASESQQPNATIKPSEEQLKSLVQEANDFIKPLNGSLQFSIDKDTGTTVVKVIDTSTKEIIKQFPTEEMLGLAKALSQLKGLLDKQQA